MLRSPQQIAALMTPNGSMPPQWFHQMHGDVFPEMTAAPELWRNVLHAFAFGWQFSGLSRQEAPTNSGVERGIGVAGAGAEFDGSNQLKDISDRLKGQSEGTVAVVFQTDVINGNHNLVGNLDSDDDGWAIWVDNTGAIGGTTNIISFMPTRESTGDSRVETSTDSVSTGELVVCHGTWDSTTPNAYVNGVLDNATVQTDRTRAWGDTATLPDLQIGKSGGFLATTPFDGIIYMIVIWDVVLTADEVLRHARDPFAMLRPGGF